MVQEKKKNPFEASQCFDVTLSNYAQNSGKVLAYVWFWENHVKKVKKFEGTFVTVAQNLISLILKVVGVAAVVNAIRQWELLAIIY